MGFRVKAEEVLKAAPGEGAAAGTAQGSPVCGALAMPVLAVGASDGHEARFLLFLRARRLRCCLLAARDLFICRGDRIWIRIGLPDTHQSDGEGTMGPLVMSSLRADVGVLWWPQTHQVLPKATNPVPALLGWTDAPQHPFSWYFVGSKASS